MPWSWPSRARARRNRYGHCNINSGLIRGTQYSISRATQRNGPPNSPRGGHVYADFRDEFKGGKVTIAATSFLRYDTPDGKPRGHLTVWMEEQKIPPLGTQATMK